MSSFDARSRLIVAESRLLDLQLGSAAPQWAIFSPATDADQTLRCFVLKVLIHRIRDRPPLLRVRTFRPRRRRDWVTFLNASRCPRRPRQSVDGEQRTFSACPVAPFSASRCASQGERDRCRGGDDQQQDSRAAMPVGRSICSGWGARGIRQSAADGLHITGFLTMGQKWSCPRQHRFCSRFQHRSA
jgi:hypothetical protein